MKVWAIVKLARQVDGEYVFVNVEKAFSAKEKAEEWFRKSSSGQRENISSPNGVIECQVEKGIFEIEVE